MPRRIVIVLAALVVLAGQPSPAAAKKLSLGETVDLNAAGYDDLLRVPGIGKVRARAILEHREGHGPFASVADLDKVKGIGKKSLKKLVPWLRVGGTTTPPPTPASPAPPRQPPPQPADKAPEAPAPSAPEDEGRGANDVEVL
jgi:competence protein ComEA